MKTAKSINWWVAIFGAWEVFAPFILGYSAVKGALWDAIIIGLALVVLGVWAAISKDESTVKNLSWVNVVLGIWLIIAPFLLSYSGTGSALWNDIIIGIFEVVFAGWAVSALSKNSAPA